MSPPKRPAGAGRETRADQNPATEEAFELEPALERLEAIAAQLEQGGTDLRQALELYREARGLYDRCVAALTEAEKDVRLLMADGQVAPEGSPGGTLEELP